MDPEERESLARHLDAVSEALLAERARHQAGLEAAPDLEGCFGAREPAAWLDAARRLQAAAAGEAEGPAAAAGTTAGLARRFLALHADREAARAEAAWRAAETAAVVASAVGGPGGRLSLCDAERALPREADRGRRAELAAALAAALEGPARHREAWAEARARARAGAGLFPDWAVVVEGDQLLGATDDPWREHLAYVARRDLGLAAAEGDLGRHDLLRLLAFPALDGLFRAPVLAAAVRATTKALGLARHLDTGLVRVDETERAAAWPGAHALGARVGYRAAGGLADWPGLLDALGRALAAAHHPPRARDPIFGAALGRLLAALCLEPRWLSEHLEVERRQTTDLIRALGLRELLRLRGAAAALRVATEVERGLSGQAWRDAHRDALTAALSATWEGVRASRDADAEAHAATLRGFAEGERLRRSLRERFDEDWWRNPRTAEQLAGLLAAGRWPEQEAASPSAEGAALALTVERGGAG